MKNIINFYLMAFLGLVFVGCSSISPESDRDPSKFHGVVTNDDLRDIPTESLRELMAHELPWTRLSATQVLAGRGPEVIPIFLEALDHEDWRVVRAGQDGIHSMLTKNGDKVRKQILKGIPSLKKNLKNEHYYVRMGALQCLQSMGPDAKSAGDAICDCTDDEDYLGVQPAAFKAIKAIGAENFNSKRLFEVMEKSVKSKNVTSRRAAIGLIQKLDKKDQRKLIPAMLYALDNQMNDGYTRYQVQGQIARLLQKLEVSETKERIFAMLAIQGWGESHRINTFMPLLKKYGGDADGAIPHLQKTVDVFEKRGRQSDKPMIEDIKKTIESIKKAKQKGGKAK